MNKQEGLWLGLRLFKFKSVNGVAVQVRIFIFLSGLVMMLSGCVSDPDDFFYVREADFYASRNFEGINGDLQGERRNSIVYVAHRIQAGKGTVIALRTFSPGEMLLADRASFKKMTVYLDSPLEGVIGKAVPISSKHAIAFLSNSSSTSPGSNGCFGYARYGSILLEQANAKELVISLDLTFDQESPLGWAGECGVLQVKEKILAQEKGFSELTSWEGKPGKSISDETAR